MPKYLKERQCKIIMGVDQLLGNGDKPLCNGLAEQGYIADKDQIAWVNEVTPDLLYHCASQHAVDLGWRGWQEMGYKVISVPLAGNPFRFYDNGAAFDIRSIDVGYIGGFWPYRAPGLFSYHMYFRDDRDLLKRPLPRSSRVPDLGLPEGVLGPAGPPALRRRV